MNTGDSNSAPARLGSSAEIKQILLNDIGAKWNRFTLQELRALKNNEELVTQVGAKYRLDRTKAQRDVDTLMKGRNL